MTTFNDLLQMPVEATCDSINFKFFYDWGIFNEELMNYDTDKMKSDNRVKVNYIKYFDYDGRRTWELGYILLDDAPVLFFRGAGREGRDSYDHVKVSNESFHELENYIRSLCEFGTECDDDDHVLSSLDEDATFMTEFYGQSLFGEFNRY